MYDDLNVAYVLPTQDMSQLLTESKLNKIIANNPVIRNAVKSSNFQRKSIGDKMLYLAYTHGSAGGIAFSSDINIYDEYARSKISTIHQLRSRLLNSKHGYEWAISNPNLVADEFDRFYQKSSQKHWAFKCSKCSKWQTFDFEENVHWEAEIFQCKHCKLPLSDEDRVLSGQWVEKYRDRDISGYWIHQAMRLNANVAEMKYEKEKSMRDFTNMYMGLPYSASDLQVNFNLIKKNLVPPKTPKGAICIGFDVGAATGHAYSVLCDGVLIDSGFARDWEAVRELINRYGAQMVAVDNGPELSQAMALQQDYKFGMVWRVKFTRMKPDETLIYEEDSCSMRVHRSQYIDHLVHEIGEGKHKFGFDELDPRIKLFADHFSTLGSTVEEDASGNMQIKWDSPDNAADHLAFSYFYAMLAWGRLQEFNTNYASFTPNGLEDMGLDPIITGFLKDDEDNNVSWMDL